MGMETKAAGIAHLMFGYFDTPEFSLEINGVKWDVLVISDELGMTKCEEQFGRDSDEYDDFGYGWDFRQLYIRVNETSGYSFEFQFDIIMGRPLDEEDFVEAVKYEVMSLMGQLKG